MITPVVVLGHEMIDGQFELPWQIVIVQQDLIFHRAVPALDLALGHRVVRSPATEIDIN